MVKIVVLVVMFLYILKIQIKWNINNVNKIGLKDVNNLTSSIEHSDNMQDV